MNKKVLIGYFLLGILVLGACFFWIYTSKLSIRLVGDKTILVEAGSTYQELGAKTIFGTKEKMKIEGKVDTSKLGTYEIKYYHFNAYVTRTVKVVDTQGPIITLKGSATINLSVDGKFQDPGYEAKDNYDGDVTKNVIVKNSVDVTKPGDYEITYTVKDSSGNESSITRKVVINKKGPLAMNLKEFSLNGYFKGTILEETKDAGGDYINETIFFGDSITENFGYYGTLPKNVIWATNSINQETALTWKVPIRPYGVEMTIVDAVKEYKPKRLVISLGANSVAVMTESYFISAYEKLVKAIKEANPKTDVIVQSIFPVDSFWDTHVNTANSINNTKVNRLNYLLAEMCERQEVKFLNSAVVLKDENGQCKKGYCYDSDGIHLTTEGHNKVVEYIRTHAYIGGE